MNLLPLYEIQRNVDTVISQNLDIDINTVQNIDKAIIAFKVELGEFANETGWFKYWKQSHVMDKSKTLEEFADCMAFMLSVGLRRRYEFIPELNPHQWRGVPLETLFVYLFTNNIRSSAQWKQGFEHLIMVGMKMGFTIAEMEVAYYTKSGVNIERQRNSY